ncbi:MAG TPA: MFS transporter [Mycobacteriales bacterium]|jgi:MFS family permease|nr:MFS transporter [Mycobacteriales bacterium]
MTTSSPTAARSAVLVHFLANGVILGIWASRLPAVKHELGLADRDVAAVIFAGAIGAMLSLRVAGHVIERFGSLRTTRIAALFMMLSLLLPAVATSMPTLSAGMLLMAGGASFQDVGMNSQAVAIERRIGRPIMSSFHAAFSIGGIAGAGAGALTAKIALSYRASFVIVSLLFTVAVVAANRWLLDAPETSRIEKDDVRGRRDLPHRGTMIALGLIGLASFVAEGAAADWTAIYLREGTGSTHAVAALGFMVFSVTMTAGRLAGDRLAARFGAMALVRLGTIVGGVGLAAGLLLQSTPAGVAGFAVLGLGISVVVPQVFSAAGQLAPGRAPAALALVSAISYLGFLTGPAVIGAIADVTDLRTALLIPAALIAAASFVASRIHIEPGVAVPEAAGGDSHLTAEPDLA